MDYLVKEEFDDETVNSFSTGDTGLEVTFSKHTDIYYLPRERENFVEQAENIAAAWKSNKPVKIVLQGSEVISVSQP
jgi:hypothetical protein